MDNLRKGVFTEHADSRCDRKLFMDLSKLPDDWSTWRVREEISKYEYYPAASKFLENFADRFENIVYSWIITLQRQMSQLAPNIEYPLVYLNQRVTGSIERIETAQLSPDHRHWPTARREPILETYQPVASRPLLLGHLCSYHISFLFIHLHHLSLNASHAR